MASKAQQQQYRAARQEFKELSLVELKQYEDMFTLYDTSKDGFLDLQELKYLMEKIGAPQTHLGLKAMIKEVDEDFDGQISYREFLLIFRYAKSGKLTTPGLKQLAASSIKVEEVGVGGAKNFFEAAAKVDDTAAKDREYFEKKKAEAEAKKNNKQAFKSKAKMFEFN